MRYEGCGVALFSGEPILQGDLFMKNAVSATTSFQEIEGIRVAVFQERREEDNWTTFVAFPKGNVVLVASNLEYLRTVISRMRSSVERAALPSRLPEWKYLSTLAMVWGLRHYERHQAPLDPSSPFGGHKAANVPDEGAVGLAFQFELTSAARGTLSYLSTSEGARQVLEHYLLQVGLVPYTAEVRLRRLAPDGTVQCFLERVTPEHMEELLLVLNAMVGHGIYL